MSDLSPFEVLFEGQLPRYQLPAALHRLYGDIGFRQPVLYSNFVSSLDGVVALGTTPSAGSVISGRNPADRFLMGLLRACADAIVIGAGTLRGTPGHHWTPEHIYPAFASEFADLRSKLGRKPRPRLVVVTQSGDIPVSHPALVEGATIVTTSSGASKLRDRLPDSCDLLVAQLADAVVELRSRGYSVVLTEGGPNVMAELIELGLLDEIFLTISPVVAGRNGESRLGMVSGAELLPGRGVWSRLLSLRRHGDFLFLRYDLRSGASL